jgi:hypothetical protein
VGDSARTNDYILRDKRLTVHKQVNLAKVICPLGFDDMACHGATHCNPEYRPEKHSSL